jgi:ribosomal protein L3
VKGCGMAGAVERPHETIAAYDDAWNGSRCYRRRQGAIESSPSSAPMSVQGRKDRAWRLGRNERT